MSVDQSNNSQNVVECSGNTCLLHSTGKHADVRTELRLTGPIIIAL